jgi:hypothetical protein
MVNEAFEFYTVKLAYIFSLTNLTQVAQNLLALIAIWPVFSGMDEPTPWGKYATAVRSSLTRNWISYYNTGFSR